MEQTVKQLSDSRNGSPRSRSAQPSDEIDPAIHLEPVFDFLRTVWLLNHRLETASKRMMETLGVTGPQRMLLRIVGRYPGIAAGALAEALHIDPGTLSSALRRLEQRKLLLRTPDPGDRRRVLITLTSAGRKVVKPSSNTVEGKIRAALAELPPESVLLTRNVLATLSRHLSALGNPGR